MSDLDRLQKGFLLNEKQRRYLEAARWLRQEEPRSAGRTTLQAYVIIEEAMRRPGEPVALGLDHAAERGRVISTTSLIPDTIRRILSTKNLCEFLKRYDLTNDTLTIFPWICGACRLPEGDHVPFKPAPRAVTRLKCPFASTYFHAGFVGTKLSGEWAPRIVSRKAKYEGPTWLDGEKNDSRDL